MTSHYLNPYTCIYKPSIPEPLQESSSLSESTNYMWNDFDERQTWYLIFRQSGNIIAKLTHWGRVTHICVGNLTIIGSDNGLSPGGQQAIIWDNAGILLTGPLEINFNEILIENQSIFIQENQFENVVQKAILSQPQCQGWGTRTQYSYSQYSSTEFIVLVLYSYSWVPKS